MNANRALIFAVVINLTCLCFSGKVMAYQRSNEPQLHSDYDIDTASLASLYPHPADYLWLNKRQLNDQATHVLEFIADSANHGLNPNDYHFDLLQQLDPTLNESEAHLFDLLLSDGLLKLIRDISIGRLDPNVVDPKWSIPRASFNATAFLQHALSTNDFKASLSSLIPASQQYLQLKAAAVRYQNYVERGGWQNIPATPVLRSGDEHINISAIRDRLSFEDDSINQVRPSKRHYYDKELEQVVKQFQRRHSLIADGIIGPATIREMNVSTADRLQQININLERLRWLPDDLGDRYIMVNLANYRLTAIEDDEVKLDMRVIVGKTKRSTPSFSSQMTHIVLNPKWYVPNKLARLDLLPKQQANPGYFERYNFRVFNFEDGIKTEINPDSVDWQAMSKQYFPYTLVQDPGKKNALGQLKFILPNPWKIYLHDTPSKSLFNQSRRNFSSGCIRVEDPIALADFSLSRNSMQPPLLDLISSNESYSAKPEQPLSVYAIYATVWLNGNEVMFSPDSYQRDQRMAEFL
ncbi:MAG: L,D-transpeptidase family protein [Gammaproteobacteria bacterium]|nr:L,D-transpeptidase family protein [Gammaproteobacteria bacterium]